MSVFTSISDNQKIYTGKYFYIIYDRYPVSPGHILIVSKEEKQDYFALDKNEKLELNTLIDLAKEFIEEDSTPDGYNIGMNCGKAAGQTIFHFHCHVIPRFFGDMENPKGGIRHCVEGKGYY